MNRKEGEAFLIYSSFIIFGNWLKSSITRKQPKHSISPSPASAIPSRRWKASFRLRYSKKKAATSSSPNMEKNFPSMSISLWKFWNTASPS